MESDSFSGQGAGSSGYDSASTLTNDTLQADQSLRSGSSGFFSNPNEGNNHGSFNLDSLPKQDMIELFLRTESQTSQDKTTAVRIQIRPDQTITDLQEKVQTETGVHPSQQYLYHEDTRTVLSGCTHKATRTMATCNIKHGSWLQYSARSRGGGGGVC